MPLVTLSAFNGANTKIHKRYLPDGVGVLRLHRTARQLAEHRMACGGIGLK